MSSVTNNVGSGLHFTIFYLITVSLLLYCTPIFCQQSDCQKTLDGREYTGTISRTRSGRLCQPWILNHPHVNEQYHGDEKFSDGSEAAASNYCRNPTKYEDANGPWCYTLDPEVRWEYCDIPPSDCEMPCRNYTGTINRTRSGRLCQPWTSNHPHLNQNYHGDDKFPDGSEAAASNYCRNPTTLQVSEGPWCYTMDPEVRWEYCRIPFCDCQKTLDGREYNGTISRTRSGRLCQPWTSNHPHVNEQYHGDEKFPDDSEAAASNYCRNPATQQVSDGPWCYTMDPDVRWEYCDIPPSDCEMPCRNYTGTINRTRSGRLCQPWTSNHPHLNQNYHGDDKFPDGSEADASNYCRNPTTIQVSERPWCYTTDPEVRWEYCRIPFCEDQEEGYPEDNHEIEEGEY